ncbi:Blue-light-activated protein [Fuerstiella marisgermanici]|uniref:histidine kinase n=1 Tax=Fuerstiella marisgermanici TaxID=1891926 RepID=A0A1P8WCT3_9PLAN|nr:Blue-light-activated protein [Fuerstiella marisgermanici]
MFVSAEAEPAISILVVEDNTTHATGIAERLKALGYSIAGLATSGDDAVRMALKTEPGIILMNIHLEGGIDGMEAAELIRRDADIPVVYLTADPDDAALECAEISAPFSYVSRPYTDHDLQTAIEIVRHRHSCEARMREHQAWLTTTLNSIGDGVIATDDQGIIRSMNLVAEELTGWNQKDAVGCALREVFQPVSAEARQPVTNPALLTLRTGESTPLSDGGLLICDDGTERFIENHASSVRDAKGRVTGSVLIFRDVTQRRQMEEDLREAQKLEATGRLAGVIAHDFNNLMTVIIGFSDFLLNSAESSPGQKDVAKQIHDAGNRAAALAHQIVTFRRKQTPPPEVLRLNDVIRDLEPLVRHLFGSSVDLCSHLDPKVGSVKADRSQLEQLVISLIANARDALPSAGQLVVSTTTEVVPDGAEQRYVRITVTAGGPSVAPDVGQHVFGPFFSSDKQTEGTGLGLAAVYGIVQQYHGRISIENDGSSNAVGCVDLPVTDATAAPVSLLEPASSDRGGETVLLVEDEHPVRRMTKMALERCGYKVLEAVNGEHALEVATNAKTRIDLLLTDLIMPLMSGRELAEKLTERRPDIGVLFMSGYSDDEQIHQTIETTRTAFLQKPFLIADLQQQIRSVLDQP